MRYKFIVVRLARCRNWNCINFLPDKLAPPKKYHYITNKLRMLFISTTLYICNVQQKNLLLALFVYTDHLNLENGRADMTLIYICLFVISIKLKCFLFTSINTHKVILSEQKGMIGRYQNITKCLYNIIITFQFI